LVYLSNFRTHTWLSLPFPLTWTTSAFFTAIFLRSRFLFSHKCHLLFDVSCIRTSTKWMSWYSQTRSIYTENFTIHTRTDRTGIWFSNPHHLIDFRRFKCFYTRYRLRPRNFRNRYPIGCTFLHAVLITDQTLNRCSCIPWMFAAYQCAFYRLINIVSQFVLVRPNAVRECCTTDIR